MRIALIADAHLSFLDTIHFGTDLSRTRQITAAVVADIARCRPDLVVWLGDSTHEAAPAVVDEFKRLRALLTVPDLVVLGNHDVEHRTKAAFAREGSIIRHGWMGLDGWNVVFLDTTRELSPENPGPAPLEEAVARFLQHLVRQASGPVLVLGHHPLLSEPELAEQFWRAVEGFNGTGVYIGGHSHQDRYRREKNWHLLEIASCNTAPTGYHLLELNLAGLSLTKIVVPIPTTDQSTSTPVVEASFYPLVIAVNHL